MKTAAVIVTFNRLALLKICINSLTMQSTPPQIIIIVDNASTETGYENLQEIVNTSCHTTKGIDIEVIRLNSNTGGAGGFACGLQAAIDRECDWCWVMDDDAAPHLDALEKLLELPLEKRCIYGSLAVDGESTAWETTTISDEHPFSTNKVNEIKNLSRVTFLPFLGMLISAESIKLIGMPDRHFFISGDDLEFCLRARRLGIPIIVISESKIDHPKANILSISIFGKKICFLDIPPWKNYYNTRNKLFIAKKYYGYRILTETIPGILLRLFYIWLTRPNKISQTYAIIVGFFDGIFGYSGKRHCFWKIKT